AMKLLPAILLLLTAAPLLIARQGYIEQYEGLRIQPELSLDSARRTPVLDLSDCAIMSVTFIRYDQRGDTVLHETINDNRRDFLISGDSLWLYRQEWRNRFFQPDSAVLFMPGSQPCSFNARMRQDQCIHSLAAGCMYSDIGPEQTLITSVGDTLTDVLSQRYTFEAGITYTDCTYTYPDSITYPVRHETCYWYAPGLRYPSAVWERYCYLGDSIPAVQYENTYVFPSYENRSVRPLAAAAEVRPAAAGSDRPLSTDILGSIGDFDSFVRSGSFDGNVEVDIPGRAVTIFTDTTDAYSLLLCDAAGRVYLNLRNARHIDISGLPPGEYIMAAGNRDRALIQKIIIR
ncbi:MAG: T9SS type A sorting domain-containing protein, partial [Muribaculaceae bacterium]|nr:T9SS type A sorting domain-containing protein [Muribaculaceae bacterium]